MTKITLILCLFIFYLSCSKRLIILGGGAAGFYVAANLDEFLSKQSTNNDNYHNTLEIVLMDQKDHYEYLPNLISSMFSDLYSSNISKFNAFNNHNNFNRVNLKYELLLKKVKFVQARILDIDDETNSVSYQDLKRGLRSRFHYDYLVYSLGSNNSKYKKALYKIKSLVLMNKNVNHNNPNSTNSLSMSTTVKPESVLIVGGGSFGTQIANLLLKINNRLGTKYDVNLVHSKAKIIHNLPSLYSQNALLCLNQTHNNNNNFFSKARLLLNNKAYIKDKFQHIIYPRNLVIRHKHYINSIGTDLNTKPLNRILTKYTNNNNSRNNQIVETDNLFRLKNYPNNNLFVLGDVIQTSEQKLFHNAQNQAKFFVDFFVDLIKNNYNYTLLHNNHNLLSHRPYKPLENSANFYSSMAKNFNKNDFYKKVSVKLPFSYGC